MNADKVILGSFAGVVAVQTWNGFKNPDKSWPLPVPPPYTYTGAAVLFAIVSGAAMIIDERVAATVAVGLLVAVLFKAAANYKGPGSNQIGGNQTPSTGRSTGGPTLTSAPLGTATAQ